MSPAMAPVTAQATALIDGIVWNLITPLLRPRQVAMVYEWLSLEQGLVKSKRSKTAPPAMISTLW
jgi:hypothetical protein